LTWAEALRFDDRVALVTGAGSGLGRAHAKLLASRGATVVVNDLASGAADGSAGAAQVAREVEADGGRALAWEADVSDETAVRTMVDSIHERFGRLDVLVNNAGLLRACDFSEMSLELFDRVMAVNLRGTVAVSRAVWPIMLGQGYGRIVSTTSNSGLLGTAGSTAYAAAKAGVWGFTRSLSLEGAEHGIHVNAIAPIAYTAMSARSRVAPESWRTGEGDAWARRLDVAQVSPAAAWLAHESCMRTGEIWSVAGGRVAAFSLGLVQGFDIERLTIEGVRDRESEILEVADVAHFGNAGEEGRQLHRRLMQRVERG
jgi:NAD(P)-dependent dehydrogenase (short-subunit alcohol dehydrogenase family)